MAGATRLELATSAVTASHWKYVVDNVIVYRDVYRTHFSPPPDRRVISSFHDPTVVAANETRIMGANSEFAHYCAYRLSPQPRVDSMAV
jgi:hypothetical protein